MKSGITLEEIKRLFNYLEENKTNGNLQIIMTTESCHDLYKLFIDFNKYQKILKKRIDKARNRLLTDISQFKEISKFRNISIEEIIQRLEYVDFILKGENNERNK